jgi:hypothetical protein
MAVNIQTTCSYGEVQSQETNEVEGKEQYHVEISNRFVALENSDTEVDINRAWETIKEYQNFSQQESRLL